MTVLQRAGRVALAVLQNRAGGVPRPSFCTYLVTYRCNARCGMCDSWRMKPGAELTPDDVARVFRSIGPLEVVRLTGGEPFLREDLPEVARAVWGESRPPVLHITTNGSFPETFPAPASLRFMVSFDGQEEEHDRSRGRDVTYAKARETVAALVALRRRLGLEVSVNHAVISPRSLEDAAALQAEMAALGVDVHSVLAYAESSMYGLKLRGKRATHAIVPVGYPLHPALQGADVEGFVARELARVPRLRDRAIRRGKRYYLRGLAARLRREPSPAPHPPCVALRSHLRLLPDGRVPVCQFNTETVGNLAEQPFDEVFRGSEAQAARRWVDDCPGCWAECEVVPSAVFSGDILRPL